MYEIEARKKEVIESFQIFDNWIDKYNYLISLGKELPEFPEIKKNDDFRIKGCQSKVWFYSEILGGKCIFYGVSDALIVSGLIQILLKVYSGSLPKEILSSDTKFIEEIGFYEHLSMGRNSGLRSMLNYIYNTANSYIY